MARLAAFAVQAQAQAVTQFETPAQAHGTATAGQFHAAVRRLYPISPRDVQSVTPLCLDTPLRVRVLLPRQSRHILLQPQLLRAAAAHTPGRGQAEGRPAPRDAGIELQRTAHTPFLVAAVLVGQQGARRGLQRQTAQRVGIAQPAAEFDTHSCFRIPVIIAYTQFKTGRDHTAICQDAFMAPAEQQAHPACIGAIHRLQARRRIRGCAHPQGIRLQGQFRALCRIHYPAQPQCSHAHLHIGLNSVLVPARVQA